MGDLDHIPSEVLVLRACEVFHITPDQADEVDRERFLDLMFIKSLEGAIQQSERSGKDMTSDQVDVIEEARRMKREIEEEDDD